MAVPEQTPFIEYTANGTTTVYPLTFDCDKSEYLIVSLDGEEAPVGSWSLAGGSITFNSAPANGVLITIERNTPFRRTTEYQSYNNSFRPSPVNKDFDLIWWKLQELGYRDQVIWLALVKEIADRIAGDDNLQNQINTIDEWLDNLQQNVNENTSDIAQLVTDLSKETADRIANDEALKEMFLAMMDEAINEGTINALAITHLDSWEALESVTNVWDGRTIYVKDLGNYRYDALTTSWVKAYQDADNVKDGAESQKQINDESVRKFNSLSDLLSYTPRAEGQTVILQSKNGVDDGRIFTYDSTLAATNNGGTILNGWVFKPKGILKTSWWGLPKQTGNCYSELLTMVNIAKANGLVIEVDLPGTYDLGDNYFPVRNPATPSASIQFADYNNLTIKCVEGVIFKTTAVTGRDVFQLNAVKNFKLLGFPKITSSITNYSGAGSNGVSITHGGENITIEVEGENLPYVVKSNYVDGGKAVSIQTGAVSNLPIRNISITLRKTANVGYGFNADISSFYLQNNPISNIKVRGFIEDAYRGVAIVLDQTAVSLGANGLNVGIDIDVVTKDCQQHYIEQRCWNLKSIVYAINTKTAANLRKGVSYDTEVHVASITGKKYGSVFIGGSVLDVDTVYKVGGTGSNGGATGACSFADMTFKVNFTSATTQFNIINSGGNIVNSCDISTANVTNLDLITLLKYSNTVNQSGAIVNKDFKIYDTVTLTSTADSQKKFGVTANGVMELSGLTAGLVGSSQVKKIPIRDLSDNVILWIPAYSS